MLEKVLSINHLVKPYRSSRHILWNSIQSRSTSSASSTATTLPQMAQLENVQKQLEINMPKMFKKNLDFSFYRNDVFCENHITNVQRKGLQRFVMYLGKFNIFGQFAFPYIRMEPLSISLIQENGTVDLRWRILYFSWFHAMDWRSFKNFEKNARMLGGRTTFYVDGEGLVYKVIIQKADPMKNDGEESNEKS